MNDIKPFVLSHHILFDFRQGFCSKMRLLISHLYISELLYCLFNQGDKIFTKKFFRLNTFRFSRIG